MPLAIPSLEINNYRAFRHLEVEGFGQVNLIVGQNNVGKTSLLEAIWLFATRGAPATLVQVLRYRLPTLDGSVPRPRAVLAGDSALSRMSLPHHLFYGRPQISFGERSSPVSIGILKDHTPLKIEARVLESGKISLDRERPDIELKTYWGNSELLTVDLSLLRFQWEDTNQPRPIPNHFIPPQGLGDEEIARLWDQSTLTEKEPQIIRALQLIEKDVQAVNFVESDDGIKVRQPIIKLATERTPIPLTTMGDGMSRLFEIILAMVNCNDGILLVDEIENGIHYAIQPEMWRLIFTLARSLNIQVFATTHSLDCIRAFSYIAQNDRKSEGVVTSLRRRERRPTDIIAVRFGESEMDVVAREGLEVR